MPNRTNKISEPDQEQSEDANPTGGGFSSLGNLMIYGALGLVLYFAMIYPIFRIFHPAPSTIIDKNFNAISPNGIYTSGTRLGFAPGWVCAGPRSSLCVYQPNQTK